MSQQILVKANKKNDEIFKKLIINEERVKVYG